MLEVYKGCNLLKSRRLNDTLIRSSIAFYTKIGVRKKRNAPHKKNYKWAEWKYHTYLIPWLYGDHRRCYVVCIWLVLCCVSFSFSRDRAHQNVSIRNINFFNSSMHSFALSFGGFCCCCSYFLMVVMMMMLPLLLLMLLSLQWANIIFINCVTFISHAYMGSVKVTSVWSFFSAKLCMKGKKNCPKMAAQFLFHLAIKRSTEYTYIIC